MQFLAWCPILVTPLWRWIWGLAVNRPWKRASQQAQFCVLSEWKPAKRVKKWMMSDEILIMNDDRGLFSCSLKEYHNSSFIIHHWFIIPWSTAFFCWQKEINVLYYNLQRNVENGWFRLNQLEWNWKRILFFDFFVFKWKVQVKGEGGILKDFALIVFFYRHKAY